MSSELDALAHTLGVPPGRLAPLESYDADQIAALDAIILGAMTAEDEAFDAALEKALHFVPRLLRPAAKKVLFGGSHG